jgi:hypothetical protein
MNPIDLPKGCGGLAWVSYYIVVAGVISFLAVFSMRETRG